MSSRANSNFHLPLPNDLRELLREEAERCGRPATALAREALGEWLRERRAQRLREEIAAYAEACAGSSADLDEDLEEAGLESLEGIGDHETR